MSRKAVLLFAATSAIWDSSFLFIGVAVEHLPPSAVVSGRTLLGAVFLLPLAILSRAFRGLRRSLLPVAAVALLDMALPTFLTAWGEERVTPSVAGILTATDSLFTAVLALWLIRSEAVDRKRFAGLVIGFAGDDRPAGHRPPAAALPSCSAPGRCCSARSATRARRCCTGAGSPTSRPLGVTALMTAMSSLAFLAPAAINLPRQPPPVTSALALLTLGIANAGLAYWLFYLPIDEAGAATASVITYVMPVVALLLGAGLLGRR